MDRHGTAAFGLTVGAPAGVAAGLSLLGCATSRAVLDGIELGGTPCGFCKVMTSSLIPKCEQHSRSNGKTPLLKFYIINKVYTAFYTFG
jgi:hypothetical protein